MSLDYSHLPEDLELFKLDQEWGCLAAKLNEVIEVVSSMRKFIHQIVPEIIILKRKQKALDEMLVKARDELVVFRNSLGGKE